MATFLPLDLTKSSFDRMLDQVNSPYSRHLLSVENSVLIESTVYDYDADTESEGPSGEAVIEHNVVGDGLVADTREPDEDIVLKYVEFTAVTVDATAQDEPFLIQISGPANVIMRLGTQEGIGANNSPANVLMRLGTQEGIWVDESDLDKDVDMSGNPVTYNIGPKALMAKGSFTMVVVDDSEPR